MGTMRFSFPKAENDWTFARVLPGSQPHLLQSDEESQGIQIRERV